ncbi:MAG: hypothetical protein C7B46_00555 [Sulfobacillus benefaciens]|uniref:Ornithine cyclodeaminase n=1 Tax=Sulfobacillus benefaciens TaxID=453960 RepID=A0A2T2XM11_9FIRM|nr:MAG: hypothetical protein C7B46_00555 [Sulfobacillus benefaciens]
MALAAWIGAEELEHLLSDEEVRHHLAISLEKPLAGEPIRVVQQDPVGHLIMMAASWQDMSLSLVKILYERPLNRESHSSKPVFNGSVTIYDADGTFQVAIDGAAFTGMRTAAIAALSTEWLALQRDRLAILGAGFEAYYHAKALALLPGVHEIYLWNRSEPKALALKARLEKLPQFSRILVKVCPRVEDAVCNADVITTVTASPSPILTASMVKPTVLINAMGAYRPTTREIDGDIVEHAALYADYLPACLAEAGEYLIPAASGRLDLKRVLPLSMARTLGPQAGITVMKSVGSAIFDLACADCFPRRGEKPTVAIP